MTVLAGSSTSKVPKYELKPVSISRISSADAVAIAAAAPRFALPPTDRRPGFINWANTRPASSYASLPTGLVPQGYRTSPVTSSLDSPLISFQTPINFFRMLAPLVLAVANGARESAEMTSLLFIGILALELTNHCDYRIYHSEPQKYPIQR